MSNTEKTSSRDKLRVIRGFMVKLSPNPIVKLRQAEQGAELNFEILEDLLTRIENLEKEVGINGK